MLNRLTQVLNPLNGTMGFTYDANGNMLTVTDARSNQTTYTYESMDRLATRVDLLVRSESYEYDLAGNMTQFTDRKSQATSYTYDALNRRTGVTPKTLQIPKSLSSATAGNIQQSQASIDKAHRVG